MPQGISAVRPTKGLYLYLFYPEEDVGFFFRMFMPLIPARYVFVRMLQVAENEL